MVESLGNPILFHGTSSIHLEHIMQNGLINPYLTKSEEIADYYAGETVDDVGGTPVILEIAVSPENLRVDFRSLEEPVTFDGLSTEDLEDAIQAAYKKALIAHPSWEENGYVCIPAEAYDISLSTVDCCRYDGVVDIRHIIIKDQG